MKYTEKKRIEKNKELVSCGTTLSSLLHMQLEFQRKWGRGTKISEEIMTMIFQI